MQIGFAHRLVALQQTHLQPALLKTVAGLDIAALDKQLAGVTPAKALQKLASFGLRGEALFMAPMVLRAKPTLLTYYRSLLGYSQKEFHKTGTGLGIFKRAEESGILGATALAQIPELCKLLNVCAWQLLQGMDRLTIDQQFLNELSLLSIGPQLRGGRNNERGEAGIEDVYQLILRAVAHAKPAVSGRTATFDNAAGRQVVVEVAADPDIVIIEKSSGLAKRPLVAIEVKAGTDASNIHNRIGEAEKSHLKTKARKFTECWTNVNVASLDPVVAAQQSPTTHRFFTLSELMETTSEAHADFVTSIVALTGIKTKPEISTRTRKML
ncbi:MAG: XcyI family restriction endonuclease [Rhodoferax sp.]|nr:XcyI family restriction endonuclease [Rhodoferax sp.]